MSCSISTNGTSCFQIDYVVTNNQIDFVVPREYRDYEREMAPLDLIPFVSNASGAIRIAMGVVMLVQSLAIFPYAICIDLALCGYSNMLRWNIEVMNYGIYNIFIGSIDQIPIVGNLMAYSMH